MTKLPPIMKKGSWERDLIFSSFEYKGETITIDTEEKYICWYDRFINHTRKNSIWFTLGFYVNLADLVIALENFLYVTHRADDRIFNK